MKKFLFLSICAISLAWLYLAANTLGYNEKALNLLNIEQARAATTGYTNVSGTILSFLTLSFTSGANVSFGNITPNTPKCGDQNTQASVTTNAANGYTLALSDGGSGGGGGPGSKTWYPIGDTAQKDLTPSSGTTNYNLVTTNDGDTTYVSAVGTGGAYKTDIYTPTSDAVPAGATNISVTVHAITKATNANAPLFAEDAIKVDSTIYYADTAIVATSYGDTSKTWSTNPAGGDWTVSSINSIGIGAGLQATANDFHYMTQLYAVVSYTASSGLPSSAMVHTDAVTYIPDMSGSSLATPIKWTADYTTQGVGTSMFSGTQKEASWGTGTSVCDTAGNKWAAIPQDATIGHTVTGFLLSPNSSFWGWRIEVPNNQKTGMYNGNVLFTGVAVLT